MNKHTRPQPRRGTLAAQACIILSIGLVCSILALTLVESLPRPRSVMNVYEKPALIVRQPAHWPAEATRCSIHRIVDRGAGDEPPVQIAAQPAAGPEAISAFEHAPIPWRHGLVTARFSVAGITADSEDDRLAIVAGGRLVALARPVAQPERWELAEPLETEEANYIEAALRDLKVIQMNHERTKP